jgi:hypothetical protein
MGMVFQIELAIVKFVFKQAEEGFHKKGEIE